MLVFVFQWGYGESLLNFTAQPIETTNPVIIFCIVFGLSMDYEVLMLSRIHEEWEVTGDNTQAVANGLQKTGRLITGAAAIMVVVFMAFVFHPSSSSNESDSVWPWPSSLMPPSFRLLSSHQQCA